MATLPVGTSPAREAAAAGRPAPVTPIGWARIVWRILGLALIAGISIPSHYLFQLLRLPSVWPRLFMTVAARLCGARVGIKGVPLKRDVFYIANHVSWVDILAISSASGTAFVAKAELASAPVVGTLARMNRTVFVEREDRLGVADQINRLRDALADNWSVTVFPEGTTTDGRSLLPFKTPMLKVLEPPPPGVMVQPVLLWYGGDTGYDIAWIGAESGRDNALRVLSRQGSFKVMVEFLEPFHPRDYPGRKAIAAESRRRIEAALISEVGAPLLPFRGHDWWGKDAALTSAPSVTDT
ncbi:1-acyl-sn-glycerol-3-phosphate acyltransferase [Sphingomonas sp. 28-63-12]|uniref:lysophospholipid acyltransferase family protein n=1 Tax=Sphingomonas sp. 28-63-12 TaxID=1970434 RepID=UPI000BD7E05E|nr:MAG: 1-acyl-sn-glycerol-3-phosphate acyltransferase [Sphingomonas sp. 28-63-12]